MSEQAKIISTQLVTCALMCKSHMLDEASVQAIIIVYENGEVEARCPINQGPRDPSRWANPSACIECLYEKKR